MADCVTNCTDTNSADGCFKEKKAGIWQIGLDGHIFFFIDIPMMVCIQVVGGSIHGVSIVLFRA